MTKNRLNIEMCSMAKISKTAKLLEYFASETLAQKGSHLTKNQLIVLLKLSKAECVSQLELAKMMKRDKAAITRVVKSLEVKGLVVREASTTDKRINNITITSNGQAELSQNFPILYSAAERVELGLTEDEKSVLHKVLDKVYNHIEEIVNEFEIKK